MWSLLTVWKAAEPESADGVRIKAAKDATAAEKQQYAAFKNHERAVLSMCNDYGIDKALVEAGPRSKRVWVGDTLVAKLDNARTKVCFDKLGMKAAFQCSLTDEKPTDMPEKAAEEWKRSLG